MPPDLSDIDLGLLLALEALLLDRNITHAAARLGLSQPALSARLNRLRRALDDSLFVPAPTGRGVVPTPRALGLAAELNEALAALRRIVEGPARFDPARTGRTFVLAIHENPAAILSPGLVTRLAREAPGARLALVTPTADIAERLAGGNVDLMVAGAGQGPGDLRQRPLLDDDFLTAQRKGHPRGTGPLDLDAFCALDHLLISSDGGGFSGLVDDALAKLGRSRRVTVSIQSYALAPVILANSNCVCTLPRRFLERFTQDLDVQPPPLRLAPAKLAALWHPRNQDDAGHQWFREYLYAVAAGSVATV